MVNFIKKAVAALLLAANLVHSTLADEQAERGKTVVVTSTSNVPPPAAPPTPSITTTTRDRPPVATVTAMTTMTSVTPFPEPPPPPANERPRLCTRYGPRHGSPFAQFWIIVETDLTPGQIGDLCGGLWDNLFGTLRDRECMVLRPGPFCGQMPNENPGVVGWGFGAGWGCSNGRVEESFFAATDHGQWGNVTCNTCYHPWPGGDCEGIFRFSGM